MRAVLGPAGSDDDAAVRVLGDADRVLALDAPGGTVVPGGGRKVVLVGVPDAVVVDTPDAVLVTTAAHAQRVKDAVAALARAGGDDLL